MDKQTVNLGKLSRRRLLQSAGLAAIWPAASRLVAAGKPAKPNIILVIGDDMTWHDCEPYGSTIVKTPNMARLASEGIRLDNMFTSTAMCAPTRQQLYTGLFPVRNGAYPNHSQIRSGIKTLPVYLKALGYRVGLVGKRHFGPAAQYPYENLGILPKTAKAVADLTKTKAFVNRDASQPFCLVVCPSDAHGPWTRGDASKYPPAKITPPPYLPDTPETRTALSHYYAEVTSLDDLLGEVLAMADAPKRKANTIVMFTSEQGSSMPFGGKWSCHDTGLKTAFLVRWPGMVKPGSSSDALCQYVDVLPTMIEAAGGKPEALKAGRPDANGKTGFDGESLVGVLTGKAESHRKHVYGVHTTRGIINGNEAWPIRSVSDGRYKLILNLNSGTPFSNVISAPRKGTKASTHRHEPDALQSWAKAGGEAAKRAAFYTTRPAVELYDLKADPWELKNRAKDETLSAIRKRLEAQLATWMVSQGDQGMKTEKAARRRHGKSPAKPAKGKK
ncbi:MAG: sulfatase [Phycisphaerales bacterium]|jgi:N-sulfoglucosamine sulfohydrolase|nr:sulfatase [Phycisphaerales bacterium]MBT7170607.1 sulfatase [Phycisphaerales bacterium]